MPREDSPDHTRSPIPLTPHLLWGRLREFFRWFYRYRSIRLTSEGTRYVLLTLAVGVAAINTGNNLLYLLLAMLLSLIVMSGLLSEQSLKQLEFRRRMPDRIFANRPATVSLSIANRKRRLPTFSLRVLDVVAGEAVERGIRLLHAPPRSVTMQSYPILVARRGRFRIEGIKLLTRFPFGLFLKAATLPFASETVVYPEIKPLPAALRHDLAGLGHDQTASRRGPGVALYNLRRYQPGDDSRAIHWKTTARQRRLMVRETETEDQRRVVLALPTTVPVSARAAFEQAVSLTASLAASFHAQGYALRLLIGSQDIPYGAGEAHYDAVLRALALCQPELEAPLPPGFHALPQWAASGEPTLVVLAWPDPEALSACRGVTRVLMATDYSPNQT
jgi:uncharacterized protein (DUF58 family)